MKKRKYTLKQRARKKEETRTRIVQATVELHEKLGPRNTTISAIADRAGVQRLTVYRHFPDERRLYAACTSHWLENHPPPDPVQWQEIEDPLERTRKALESLYAYFRGTEAMWTAAYRDRPEVPAMEEPMAQFDAYLEGIRHDLLDAWETKDTERSDRPHAVLGLALRLCTWQSLNEEGLTDPDMAALVASWVESAAHHQEPGGRRP